MSKRPFVIAGWVGVAVLCLALVRANVPHGNPPAGKDTTNNARTTRVKVADTGMPGAVGYGPAPGYGVNPGAGVGPGPATVNPGTGVFPGSAPVTPGMGTGPATITPGASPYMGNSGMTTGPAAGNEAATRTGAGDTTNAGGTQSSDNAVLSLVNSERSKAGLSPLTLNKQLSDVARTKAQDMRDQNYFDHTSPTYGSPADMIKRFNIPFQAMGENIAAGQQTPAEVMQGWMNSEGHRRNILDPQFTQMGIGSVQGGQMGTYWSQMFISQ
ncbi:CAP domain-containing protein [Brevibacillus fluminis]|uniref:CAP domain-containing protein n=1 Tax=Brevibacillus fluminis TaxID=511487 RepID=UPI003F8CAEBE